MVDKVGEIKISTRRHTLDPNLLGKQTQRNASQAIMQPIIMAQHVYQYENDDNFREDPMTIDNSPRLPSVKGYGNDTHQSIEQSASFFGHMSKESIDENTMRDKVLAADKRNHIESLISI